MQRCYILEQGNEKISLICLKLANQSAACVRGTQANNNATKIFIRFLILLQTLDEQVLGFRFSTVNGMKSNFSLAFRLHVFSLASFNCFGQN